MLEKAHLVERVARRLAADGSVSRRELLLGTRRENETKGTAETAGPPATPQEAAALRVILDSATPETAELRALVDALVVPGADGTLSTAARSGISKLRARIRRASTEASSVRRRSDLRRGLISYLADSDALLATLEDLGSAPDPAGIPELRARLTRLNTRITATEKQILPRLHPAKAKRP